MAPTLVHARSTRSDSADAFQIRSLTGQYSSFTTLAATSQTYRASSGNRLGRDSSTSHFSMPGLTYPGGSLGSAGGQMGSLGS
eukprot:2690995-Pleurochrysis_carterae.AAC.1